jgi:hypothetical protein
LRQPGGGKLVGTMVLLAIVSSLIYGVSRSFRAAATMVGRARENCRRLAGVHGDLPA